MTVSKQISGLEILKVRFRLQFLESFLFKPEMILHWRKELMRGALFSIKSGTVDSAAVSELLNPSPSVDPYAQKRFQKPSPPFVVDPSNLAVQEYSSGDVLHLEVLFPGDGSRQVLTYLQSLVGLGHIGMYRGIGRFNVTQLATMTHNEGWRPVWHEGESLRDLPFSRLKADWLIEEKALAGQSFVLRFLTPARLLRRNRPLFTAEFKDLFPYMLRRVTSVLYSTSRLELNGDISSLITTAEQVRSQDNLLKWTDWRHLDADHGVQGVGGLSGTIRLCNNLTDDLITLLCLAEMFHIGKWASYGAGCFVIEPDAVRH